MRSYAQLSPTFWTRGSGKRIRGDKNAQLVALYLMSSPATSMVGIFHLALPTLCHETGLTEEAARAGLARCEAEEIAFWDEAEELVWIPALARYQLGDELKPGKGGKADHRVKGVERALSPYRGHRFCELFVKRYGEAYHLSRSPSEAPSKPLADVDKGLPSPYDPAPALVPDHDPDHECMPSGVQAAPVPPSRERVPTNLADALRLPVDWRARALVSQPLNAQWANPHEWPENVHALAVFERATGTKRGFSGPTDPGLISFAKIYATGRTEAEVATVLPRIIASEWWRRAKRGLSSITVEVFNREFQTVAIPANDDGADAEARRAKAAAVEARARAGGRA